jgi:hypothetical protein
MKDTVGKNIFTCVYSRKRSSPPEPEGQFQSDWYKGSLGKGNTNCKNQEPGPVQRGDNHNHAKIG